MLPLLILAVLSMISAGLGNHGSRVVCYYAGWAGQRRPPYAVFPRDLPPDLCTHIIFSAAVPSLETGIAPADPPQLSLNGYREAVSLKSLSKEGLKVLLSLEAIEDGSRAFSQLVEDSQVRGALARGAVALLRALKMDGLDINWQFPGLRSPKDPENFVAFLKEMREEMDQEGLESGREPLLLTLSVPPIEGLVRLGFSLERLEKYVDWLNVLAMDYHTSNEKETAHPSPLYSLPGDTPNAHLNVDSTIKFFLSQGVQPKKVVIGIPLYGRTFLLQSAFQTQLGAPARTRSTRRQHIKDTLALYELCRFVEKGGGWTTERPNATAMGPYSFYADVWVAYDDIDMVTRKAQYVKSHGLGGLAFWTVDQDDVLGECGPRYATVAAARAALSEQIPAKDSAYAPASYPSSTEPSWQENSVSPPGERPVDPILVGQGGRPAIADVEGISVQPSKVEAPQAFGPSSSSAVLPPFTPIPEELPEPTPTQAHTPEKSWDNQEYSPEQPGSSTPLPSIPPQEQTPSTFIYTGYAPYAPNIPFVFEEVSTEAPMELEPVKGNVPYNPDNLWGPRENISNINPQSSEVPYTPDHLWGPRENISSELTPSGDIPFVPDHLWGPRENISASNHSSHEEIQINNQYNLTSDDQTQKQGNHGYNGNAFNEVTPSYESRPFSEDNLWGPRKNISDVDEVTQQPQAATVPTYVTQSTADVVSTYKPSRGNTVYSGTRRPTKGDRSRDGMITKSVEDYLDTQMQDNDNTESNYDTEPQTTGNGEDENVDGKRQTEGNVDNFDAIKPANHEKDDRSDAGQESSVNSADNTVRVHAESDDEPKWISALNKALSQLPVTFNGTLRKPGHSTSDFNIVSNIKPITSLLGQTVNRDDQWDTKGEASNTDGISESNISIQEQFPDDSNFPILGRVVLNNTRDVFLQTVHIHVTNHFYYNTSEEIPN